MVEHFKRGLKTSMTFGMNRPPGDHSFIGIMLGKVPVEKRNIFPEDVGFARNAIFTDRRIDLEVECGIVHSSRAVRANHCSRKNSEPIVVSPITSTDLDLGLLHRVIELAGKRSFGECFLDNTPDSNRGEQDEKEKTGDRYSDYDLVPRT